MLIDTAEIHVAADAAASRRSAEAFAPATDKRISLSRKPRTKSGSSPCPPRGKGLEGTP